MRQSLEATVQFVDVALLTCFADSAFHLSQTPPSPQRKTRPSLYPLKVYNLARPGPVPYFSASPTITQTPLSLPPTLPSYATIHRPPSCSSPVAHHRRVSQQTLHSLRFADQNS